MLSLLLFAQVLTSPVNSPAAAIPTYGLGDPRNLPSFGTEDELLCLTHKRTGETFCKSRRSWRQINRRAEQKAKATEGKP